MWYASRLGQVLAVGLASAQPATPYLDVTVQESLPTFRMVLLPAGQFRMGAPDYTEGGVMRTLTVIFQNAGPSYDAGPIRTTTVSSFYLATTKVTIRQFCTFVNDAGRADCLVLNPWAGVQVVDNRYEPIPGYEDFAVCTATWEGAVAYCEWLTAKTGLSFRLPTEAEWEWAAAGNTARSFPWGNEFDMNVRYTSNENQKVGSYPANATPEGILDMVGPVAEWCSDFYGKKYDPNANIDPRGPATGPGKVLRGRATEPFGRIWSTTGRSGVQGGLYGFRVVMNTCAPPQKAEPPRDKP